MSNHYKEGGTGTVPSLAFLALSNLSFELLEGDITRLVNRTPSLRLTSDKVEAHNNMLSLIEELAIRYGGEIFGSYPLSKINQFRPLQMDIRFPTLHERNNFSDELDGNFYLCLVKPRLDFSKQKVGLRPMSYCITRYLVFHKKYPDLYIPMEVSIKSDWKGCRHNFDIDMLTITSHGMITFPVSKRDEWKLVSRIVKKVLRVNDANDIPSVEHKNDGSECILRFTPEGIKLSESMIEMENEGWTIEGKGGCDNPCCVHSSEESWTNYVNDRLADVEVTKKYVNDRLADAEVTRSRLLGYRDDRNNNCMFHSLIQRLSQIENILLKRKFNFIFEDMRPLSSHDEWRLKLSEEFKQQAKELLAKEVEIARIEVICRAKWLEKQRTITWTTPPNPKEWRRTKMESRSKARRKKGLGSRK